MCYIKIKCCKQSPYRINKQDGIADIKPGCYVALLLAEQFSPWQRGIRHHLEM